MAIKTRSILILPIPTLIASSTVLQSSTAAMSLMGAHLQDTVPVCIFNPSTQAIYLGGSSMTTASTNLGLPFSGPGYFVYDLFVSEALFGITTAGEFDVTVQAARQGV